jgi:predicted protein tyrosine phosphatase
MEIKVLSRKAFEEFTSDKKYIVISITDPNSEPVESQKGYLTMLSLEFHDVDHRIKKQKDCKLCDGTGKSKMFPDVNDGHCYACTDKIDIILFDENMAQQILDFVTCFKDKVDMIVVHCEAGISRSAGVAGALSKILNGDDKYYFDHYLPNMLVYRTILNTYFKND